MIDRDSTQSAPAAPPHYQLLSHPLVHYPDSPSYLGCLDILHNAVHMLDLLQHLNLDDISSHGGMSSDAAGAFYWLTRMQRDTLRYVRHILQEAWAERDAENLGDKLQQSVFFKALQEPVGSDKPHIYSVVASCLNIQCADIETFIATIEGQQLNAADVSEGRC